MTLTAGRNTGAVEDITTTRMTSSRLNGQGRIKQLSGPDQLLLMMPNVPATAAAKIRTRTETMSGARTSTGTKRMIAKDRITAHLTGTGATMSTPRDVTTRRESATRIAAVAARRRTARTDTEIGIESEIVTGTETETETETTAADTEVAVGSTRLTALPLQAATRALTRPRARVALTSRGHLEVPGPAPPRRKMRILWKEKRGIASVC